MEIAGDDLFFAIEMLPVWRRSGATYTGAA
jgi:hypothetical protein